MNTKFLIVSIFIASCVVLFNAGCLDVIQRQQINLIKMIKKFLAKKPTFGPKKGHFGQSGPRNGTPSGQTAIYRKTEVIQCYLRICGCYDLIKSGSSEPKKKRFYRCSVKKSDFWAIFGPKMGSCRPPGARSATWGTQKRCLFGVWSWW